MGEKETTVARTEPEVAWSGSAHGRSGGATRLISALVIPALAALLSSPAEAQFVQQFIEQENVFRRGWAAVFLEVDPPDGDPDVVFAGLDWESVWTYLPGDERSAADRWLVHYREGPDPLNTLRKIRGQRAYLIRMLAPGDIRIIGRPLRAPEALDGGFHNLFGARIDAEASPSFDEHFSHPNARGKVESIFTLAEDGFEELVPGSSIESGRAYWVFAREDIAGAAPIEVSTGPRGLVLAGDNRPFEVELEVPVRSVPRFVTLRAEASATPPPGEPPDASAGDPAFLEFRDPETDEFFPLADGVSLPIHASETRAAIELRVFQDALGGGKDLPEGTLQAVIEVVDGDGNRESIGVTFDPDPLEGLWVGELQLDAVGLDPAVGAPEPVAAPRFTGALILRLPESGAAELLPRVRFQAVRDGRPFERRFEAVLFHDAIALSGSIDDDGRRGFVEGSTVLPADHPLNPYRHRYHPEHREGYEVTRRIRLEFEAADPDPLRDDFRRLGLGAQGLFGTYREEILGLSGDPIVAEGSFRLRRIAGADEGE